jgi:hypothetical protein
MVLLSRVFVVEERGRYLFAAGERLDLERIVANARPTTVRLTRPG